jgi:DNA polymerase I-like protein with 3'-5' exonuclease and polymerase domains
MGYVLTFDMETHDPAISQKRGAGWVYSDFEVLGTAYKIDGQEPQFTANTNELKEVVKNARTLIAHNAQYDLGCLTRLGIPFNDKLLIDTAILAKLFDNTMMRYNLDVLSADFLGERKDYALLEEVAAGLGIKKYMSNMRELFRAAPDVVIRYAKKDVELTYKLSQWFKEQLYPEALQLLPMYSDLLKMLTSARAKGVRIDLDRAARSADALNALQEQYTEEFYQYCPGVNLESTKQLSAAFRELGLQPGVSDKGGDSVDSKWRSTQDHPAIAALDKAKKYQKLRREFVDGIIERSENGRLYPEINILGAIETGRFSSSNPNIQQIPKRDELATELIRSIFIPEDGETWYSLDFSSQEPRLQVHYAYLAQCSGSALLRQSFLTNPQHDLHQQVADLAHVDRKTAKTINLGISYGMGVKKLAAALKLDETSARRLIKQYNELTPYLNQLNKAVQDAGMKKGYIKTLLGRRLAMDFEKPYKALNKLIQGSAADQTMMAMVQAYREGLSIGFSVHDELNLSAPSPKDARRLKEIMETIAPLEVPCYTEITSGPSWGSLSPLT